MSEPRLATRRDNVQALCVLFRKWLATLSDDEVDRVLGQWMEAQAEAGCALAPSVEEMVTVGVTFTFGEN